MSGHEFENKVQAKLDELRLSPSDAVWTQLASQIQKRKRRRRVIFLLMPLLVLLGAGGAWSIWDSSPAPVAQTSKSESNDNDRKNAANPSLPAPLPETGTAKSNPGEQDNIAVQQAPTGAARSFTEDYRKGIDDVHSLSRQKRTGPVSVQNPSRSKAAGNSPVNRQLPVADGSKDYQAFLTTPETAHSDRFFKASLVTRIPFNSDGSPARNRIALPTDSLTPVAPPSGNRRRPQNWSWGLQGLLGASRIVEGGIGQFFGSAAVQDNASYMPASGNQQQPAFPAPGKASTVSQGFHWQGGIYAERKISRRVSLSAALLYSYFSTSHTVGKQVDSLRTINNSATNSLLVRSYYLNDRQQNYTNKYHFIELPVSMHVQLNPESRIPLRLTAGLNFAQLIQTNALQYDGVTGVYYKDPALIRKSQLGIHAGFSVIAFARSARPLELGPFINYKISSLMRNVVDQQRNMLQGGLQLRWNLHQ